MLFPKSYNLKAKSYSSGQAVLGSVIFLVLLSVVIIAGFATPLTRELKSVRTALNSRQSYFAAESGVEDAAYRLKKKLAYSSSYNLAVAGAETAVTVTEEFNDRLIESAGDFNNHRRKVSMRFNLSEAGADLLYGVQVSDGGLTMKNGSTVNGNVYSNGNIICTNGTCTITGDAIVAGGIGGVSTKIEGARIGNTDNTDGDGFANVFNDVKIRGADCPNEYCHIDNPARVELPISEELIQDWRDQAQDGGVCAAPTCDSSGNLTLGTNDSLTLGPMKIPGNLVMNSGSKLTLNGTIWVGGVMDLSCGNNGLVDLTAGYGATSGVLLGDGNVTISNNCKFDGSGEAGSYIILLSAKNAPNDEVMSIDNNSAGVIYYVGRGKIKFSNNATAKEATAYGIIMDNNSVITYEEGIGNVLFSSGPGGAFRIKNWQEVE